MKKKSLREKLLSMKHRPPTKAETKQHEENQRAIAAFVERDNRMHTAIQAFGKGLGQLAVSPLHKLAVSPLHKLASNPLHKLASNPFDKLAGFSAKFADPMPQALKALEEDFRLLRELGYGDEDIYRAFLEIREATGYDFDSLDFMPRGEFNRIAKAILRKRKADAERKDSEYSGPMLKSEVARRLGIEVECLRRRIKRGEIQVKDNKKRTVRVHQSEFKK